MAVTWAPFRLQSPAVGQVVQQVVQTNSKENNKAPYNWPFVMGIPMTFELFSYFPKTVFFQTFSTNGFTIQHAWNHCNSLLFLKCDRDPCCLVACATIVVHRKTCHVTRYPQTKFSVSSWGTMTSVPVMATRFPLFGMWLNYFRYFGGNDINVSIAAGLNRLHMPGIK